ncbi:MAG: phospholipase [Acidobacteria bacterium]|nr:phospholipase [Acidobacteriota bacterium]
MHQNASFMGWACHLLAIWMGAGCAELVLDDAYGPKAVSLIGQARSSVTVAMYLMSAGGGVSEIERSLATAVGRKVVVRVVLEQSDDPDDDVTATNRATAERLRAAGVSVSFDCPERRSHLKILVVDSRLALAGSHNLTYSALRTNNEVSVMIDDPELAVRLEEYVTCLKEGLCRDSE